MYSDARKIARRAKSFSPSVFLRLFLRPLLTPIFSTSSVYGGRRFVDAVNEKAAWRASLCRRRKRRGGMEGVALSAPDEKRKKRKENHG